MSFVIIQAGQCGIQLGQNIFDLLSDNILKSHTSFNDVAVERFFLEDGNKLYARSVLIDTEPKVLEAVLKPQIASKWFYRDCNFVRAHDLGSGNNWAMGYFCNGPSVREAAVNAVRKEAERCDNLIGLLQFSSVAGGTGSGLGSYLAEHLCDEFPSKSSANITVWPFKHSDVTIHAYNSVLCLSSFQQSSDAIFLFENDLLMKLCRQKLRMKAPSLNDLNRVASLQIASILLPPAHLTFNDVLAQLVPHPQFKLVGLCSAPQEPFTSVPFSAHTWSALMQSLKRMLLYDKVAFEEVCGPHFSSSSPISLSNLLILQGRDFETAKMDIFDSLPYASWVPPAARLKTVAGNHPFLQYDRTAVVANNGQLQLPCVEFAMRKAWKMFSHKAYLHHYEQCGLSSDDFKESVMTVEQIIESYKSLHT